jgi:orotidine-5'-phosphate decarboxylase
MTFRERLGAALQERGRLCAGIDPHAALLGAWGLTDDVDGLERFAMTAVAALAGDCAVVKPQSAFFERHGARGVAVLEKVIAGCRDLGALVLLDVKRGDIGSTVRAYADAYLDPASPLAADAVTASPFLGLGSLDPLLEAAAAHDAGVFVLALTSNPEGHQVQHASTATGRSVAADLLAGIAAANGQGPTAGSAGAVVGATVDLPADVTADTLDIGGPLLVPGIGAQGGTLADVQRVFGSATRHVVPAISREILGAGPDQAALRAAARRAADTFAALS